MSDAQKENRREKLLSAHRLRNMALGPGKDRFNKGEQDMLFAAAQLLQYDAGGKWYQIPMEWWDDEDYRWVEANEVSDGDDRAVQALMRILQDDQWEALPRKVILEYEDQDGRIYRRKES